MRNFVKLIVLGKTYFKVQQDCIHYMKKYCSLVVIFFVFFTISGYPLYPLAAAQSGAVDGQKFTSSQQCMEFTHILSIRSKDKTTQGEVTQLQKFLLRGGYLTGEVSGYYGVLTEKAVKLYQKENSIAQTGRVDIATRKLISKKSCDGFYGTVLHSVKDTKEAVSKSVIENGDKGTTSQVYTSTDLVLSSSTEASRNHMSCASPSFKKLANGQVGCYGIWSDDHVFGDDVDMCPKIGHTPGVGCKLSTIACEAGQAFATRAVKPGLLTSSSEDLITFAKNLHSTPEAVKKSILILWEYRCSDYGLSTYGSRQQ